MFQTKLCMLIPNLKSEFNQQVRISIYKKIIILKLFEIFPFHSNNLFYILSSTEEIYGVLDKLEHVDSENIIRIHLVRQNLKLWRKKSLYDFSIFNFILQQQKCFTFCLLLRRILVFWTNLCMLIPNIKFEFTLYVRISSYEKNSSYIFS